MKNRIKNIIIFCVSTSMIFTPAVGIHAQDMSGEESISETEEFSDDSEVDVTGDEQEETVQNDDAEETEVIDDGTGETESGDTQSRLEESEEPSKSEQTGEELFSSGEENTFTDGNASVQNEEEKILVYALNDSYTTISIPSELPVSYQIPEGNEASYKIISGKGLKVDWKGVVTPVSHEVYVFPSGTLQNQYYYGDNEIEITKSGKTRILHVEIVDYAEYYAEKIMQKFLDENINASMTDYEKVETICKWIADNYDYSSEYNGYIGLMIYGGGSCWANTGAVNYMCRQLGIQCYTRPAYNDPGAGSGHTNSLVVIDGENYIADCGFVGKAPRHYKLDKLDSDYTIRVLSNHTCSIVQYDGTDTDVIVPEEISGYRVVKIGELAFGNAVVDVESVTLPDSITTLADNAFFNCKKLKSITIPKNVTSIGARVFGPGDVNEEGLKEINVDPENAYYKSVDGVLFDKSGETLIAFPPGKDGAYSAPEGTEKIGTYAFYCSVKLQELTLPSSVKELEEAAFGDCSSLTRVTLHEGLEIIGKYAFYNDRTIECITIPESVASIGSRAFSSGRIKVLGMKTTAEGDAFSTSVVSGKENSEVQKYAKENNMHFVVLDSENNANLEDEWFANINTRYVYYKNCKLEPEIRTTKENPGISENRDYVVSYEKNDRAGEAIITITGKGMFAGKVIRTFTIEPEKVYFDDAYFKEGNSYPILTATGKPLEPEIVVDGYVRGIDYDITYKNNIKPGTATVILTAKGNYKGTREFRFYIEAQTPKPTNKPSEKQQTFTVKLKTDSVQYNGKAQKVGITVTDAKGKKLSSSQYTVKYKNNKNIGIASVTVTGKGKYAGTVKTRKFKILPKTLKFTKIYADKKSIKVQWKKDNQVTSYEIQYSPGKYFTASTKWMKVGKNTTSVKLSGLKGKKYYIRIRSCKKTGDSCLYSKWSSTKQVQLQGR